MRSSRSLATVALVTAGLCAGAFTAGATTSASGSLGPDGIGAVRFGLPKAQAVTELTAMFGPPTWRHVSDGCGPRYTEVEWGDLAAEFRLDVFSGYRYAFRSYLQHSVGAPRRALPAVSPRLATAKGITLGSTVAQLRDAYTALRSTGPNKRHTPSGLFFLGSATHAAASPSSPIVEIKTTSTCGDY